MRRARLLNEYFRCYGASRAMLKGAGVLPPFVLFAALQCVVLVACAFFATPPLASVMVPVIGWVSGEEALHFPMHFVLLPRTYHLIYLPMVAVLGFVLFGWAVFRMGDHLEAPGGRKSGPAKRTAVRRSIPSMILVGVVYVTLATLPPALFGFFSRFVPNPVATKIFWAVGVILTLVFQALLVYSLVFLRSSGQRAAGAIKQSVTFASNRFWLTLLIVLTIFLLHQPVDFLLNRPDKVVLRFNPEMVFFLLMVGVGLELITTYFLFSSTASIALSKKRKGHD